MIFFDLFGFYVTYCDVTCEFSFSMVNYRLEDFSLKENEQQQQHSYEVKSIWYVNLIQEVAMKMLGVCSCLAAYNTSQNNRINNQLKSSIAPLYESHFIRVTAQ